MRNQAKHQRYYYGLPCIFFLKKKSKTTAYPVAAIKTIDGWMSCKQTSTTVEKTEEIKQRKEMDLFFSFSK
jgi:hypothetical protein